MELLKNDDIIIYAIPLAIACVSLKRSRIKKFLAANERKTLDEECEKNSIFIRKRLVRRQPGQGLLNTNRNRWLIADFRHFSGVVWTKNI